MSPRTFQEIQNIPIGTLKNLVLVKEKLIAPFLGVNPRFNPAELARRILTENTGPHFFVERVVDD